MSVKYLDFCDIKDEHIINISNILYFHGIDPSIRKNELDENGFVVTIGDGSFYVDLKVHGVNFVSSNEGVVIKLNLPDASKSKNTGIVIAHFLLGEKCQHCVCP